MASWPAVEGTFSSSVHIDALGGMPAVLSVEEAAKVLRIGRNQTYDAIRSGLIGHVRVGRRILIPRAALERFLADALGTRR